MHIVDGALSTEILITGSALTIAGIFYGLKTLTIDQIPQVGIMSAAFFVASLIHVPIGVTSIHLIMNGLLGLLLGWAAFPAISIALLLQAVFFGFGGLTVLGVNSFILAFPAILVFLICRGKILHHNGKIAALWGGLAGLGSILFTTVLVVLVLYQSGKEFMPVAKLVMISNLPVAVIEGILTAATLYLIHKVKPEALTLWRRQ